jgi:hypothetical protein
MWSPRKLERMLAFGEEHPAVDVLHSGTVVFDQHGQEREYLDKPSPLSLAQQFRWNHTLMQTVMVPRVWLHKVGPFQRRKDIVPDWDFGIRLMLAGARIECVREPLTRVRRFQHGHISQGGFRQMRRRTATVREYWPTVVETVGRREAYRILSAIVREEGWKLPPLVGRPVVATAWAVERLLAGFHAKH